jgi:hypothetical protein
VDSDVAGDLSDTGLSADDYQLGILPGEVFGTISQVYRWYPRDLEGSLETVTIVSRKTDEGYQVEVAIPWSELGIQPQVESLYGFGVSVNDNDSPEIAAQESLLSFSANYRLANPFTWGRLILMSAP